MKIASPSAGDGASPPRFPNFIRETHTFATTVTLSKSVPIESVGKMLGHKSLKTTQIYTKVLDEKVGNDMEALEQKMRLQK